MKIFCIGLHKTATLSLATALGILGYDVRHGYKRESDSIKEALYDGVDPLKYLEERHQVYDAYADLYAVRDHFVWLDKHYEDSKFILTTREEDEWVGSVKRQIEKRPDSPFFHHWYYQSELQWRHHKRMHERCVGRYFTGCSYLKLHQLKNYVNEDSASSLLIMDITKGDGWEELCSFLDEPIPDHPFPHENKSPHKKQNFSV